MDRKPRRQAPRLNLGITAEFVCLEGRQSVVLEDISATGAKFSFARHRPLSKGILRWLGYEVFGEIQWVRDGHCGILFDRPISAACLFATRTAAPGAIIQERANANSHARDFVRGCD